MFSFKPDPKRPFFDTLFLGAVVFATMAFGAVVLGLSQAGCGWSCTRGCIDDAPLPATLVCRRAGSLLMIVIWSAIYETKARCRHFRSFNIGACLRATEWSAAKEANKGGRSKRRPDRHQQ